jgi:hypothetical protein
MDHYLKGCVLEAELGVAHGPHSTVDDGVLRLAWDHKANPNRIAEEEGPLL